MPRTRRGVQGFGRWLKKVLTALGGLPVGRRTFTVAPCDGAVEFRMHLRMIGPLAPLILKSVGDRQPEIDSLSFALRAHVERHQGSQTT